MKNLLIAFFILVSATAFSQTQPDTLVNPTDTIVLESTSKSSFGDKLGKFLGISKEKEIENLKETIIYQQVMIDSLSNMVLEPRIIVKNIPSLDKASAASLKKDAVFLDNLPESYNNLGKEDLTNIAKEIDNKIAELMRQRDSLVNAHANKEVIDAKDNLINSLEREKTVINLSKETDELEGENGVLVTENDDLKIQESKLKKYLGAAMSILVLLVLFISLILQRKTIRIKDLKIDEQLSAINKKNTYLEYAARIIRHDMHSGINTYMPRGIISLEKRLTEDQTKELKIDGALKMIKEGLAHTQKVYKNVYEFTNLVKVKVDFKKEKIDLKSSLEKYLSSTSYASQVEISDLGEINVNEQLMCNAIDNLIRNGLKYNDCTNKAIKIYRLEDCIIVEDNGLGLASDKFTEIVNKGVDANSETGLGLGITKAILEEHGFTISCDTLPQGGTQMKITLKK
jgi:signal transduction histidine kinase